MKNHNILKRAEELKPKIVEWRRHIHQHPELSFEEYETVKYVKEKLEDLNFEIDYPVAKTGLTATLKGESDGPTVALRADMDALPIQEESDIPYKSTNEGVGHMCGHDAHTAILLGVAHLIAENPPKKETLN